MRKTISGTELRDRLLAKMAAAREAPAETLVQVLNSPGNRDLLGLIGRRSPRSVSELSELAGRAQPNVSRSLSALIGAGLVAVQREGQRSVPVLTELGRESAAGFGLLEPAADTEIAAYHPGSSVEPGESRRFLVEFDEAGKDRSAEQLPLESGASSEDRLEGQLRVWLRLRGESDRRIATHTGDLNHLALHVIENWWRMLYRRDAPFKLCDLIFVGGDKPFGFAIRSFGRSIEFVARAYEGMPVMLDNGDRRMNVDVLEARLLNEFLSPVEDQQQYLLRFDRPLHDMLNRLREARSYPSEFSFCKTVGALGKSPHNLPTEAYEHVQALIRMLPDEEARLDFASAVLLDELAEGENWVRAELESKAEINLLRALPELRAKCSVERPNTARPWEWATCLARVVRKELGLSPDHPLEGLNGLARMFGADGDLAISSEAPGTIRAFQAWHEDVPTVVVEDEGDRKTSFVLARAIGDYLAYGSRSSCVADLYTDRQAAGRAFAAEFMAPAEGVIYMIEKEDQPRNRVADFYGVSPEVIVNQYENNYLR